MIHILDSDFLKMWRFSLKADGDFRQSEAIIDNVLSASQSKSVVGFLGRLTFFFKLKFPVVKNDGAENLSKGSPDNFRKECIILVIH